MQKAPTAVEPSEGSRPGSSGRASERTRSSQARWKSTESERSGRGRSSVRRTPDRSFTPNRSRTPVRGHTPERETNFGKKKSRARTSSPPNCMMLEAAPTTSKAAPSTSQATSRAASHQESEPHTCSCPPYPPPGINLAQTPTSGRNHVSGTAGDRTPRAEGTGDSEEEVDPSPIVRRVLTRLQHVTSPGASSFSGGLDASYKEKTTPKKPRSS